MVDKHYMLQEKKKKKANICKHSLSLGLFQALVSVNGQSFLQKKGLTLRLRGNAGLTATIASRESGKKKPPLNTDAYLCMHAGRG